MNPTGGPWDSDRKAKGSVAQKRLGTTVLDDNYRVKEAHKIFWWKHSLITTYDNFNPRTATGRFNRPVGRVCSAMAD